MARPRRRAEPVISATFPVNSIEAPDFSFEAKLARRQGVRQPTARRPIEFPASALTDIQACTILRGVMIGHHSYPAYYYGHPKWGPCPPGLSA